MDTLQDAPEDNDNEISVPALTPPSVSLRLKPKLLKAIPAEAGPRNGNFWRSAKWSPDGSCVLTQEEDRLAKIFTLPPELLDVSAARLQEHLALPVAPAALLGLEWFPFASLSRPEAFCFLRSVRDLPVQLIDGNTGKVRASYSIIDHQERFVGPNSMTFSGDGRKLYCGFEGAIECFDVAEPGSEGVRHALTPSRKAKNGQKGIISSIALSPDGSGLMAIGSFSKSLYLYDASGGEPRLQRSLKSKNPIHRGAGVTQVKFHPTMPNYVYATSRRMNHILMWDVRNPSDVLITMNRPGNTQQRIEFDIDPWGKWLTTGATDGTVSFFDTHDPNGEVPVASHLISKDTVSSASLHPLLPILLTTNGARQPSQEHRPRRRSLSSSSSGTASTASTSRSSDSDTDTDTDSESGRRPSSEYNARARETASPVIQETRARSNLTLWSVA